MTDQQPYTPTIYDIRDQFIEAWAGDFVFGKVDAAKYFDRALDAHNARITAAAEQRGAIKALRDTADHIENEIEFVLPNRYKPLRFRRSYEQDGTGLTPEEWLRARADQMEGDDE